MHRRRIASITTAATVIAGTALTLAAQSGATTAAAPALSSNWYSSAPYLMPQSNNPPDPVAVMAATGQTSWPSSSRPTGAGAPRPGTGPRRSPRTPRSPG